MQNSDVVTITFLELEKLADSQYEYRMVCLQAKFRTFRSNMHGQQHHDCFA